MSKKKINKKEQLRIDAIDKYWEENKDYIIERARAVAPPDQKKEKTEDEIKAFWYGRVDDKLKLTSKSGRHLSVKQAINKAMNTNLFKSTAERFVDHAYSRMVKDKSAYQTFRNLTRDKTTGQYTTILKELWMYDGRTIIDGIEYASYIYNNAVQILIANSPDPDNISGVIVRSII